MKGLLLVILLTIGQISIAQLDYKIIPDPKDPKSKILKGRIDKNILQTDSSFAAFYFSSQKNYRPDSTVLSAFNKKDSAIYFLVFLGTWCDDSQDIIPKFFKLQELSGIKDDHLTIFGVDRNKKTSGHIAETFGIENVPTIIVMKKGVELGRVVEFGKTGKWDRELAEIVGK